MASCPTSTARGPTAATVRGCFLPTDATSAAGVPTERAADTVVTSSSESVPLDAASSPPLPPAPTHIHTFLPPSSTSSPAAGWCDGQDVSPWVVDVTSALRPPGGDNTIHYRGLLLDGSEPRPAAGEKAGQILMQSNLVLFL